MHLTSGHASTGSRWGIGTPNTQTTTQKIKSISREARQNELISDRLKEWKSKMRERGQPLTPLSNNLQCPSWVFYSRIGWL